jgi:hypothetical protein
MVDRRDHVGRVDRHVPSLRERAAALIGARVHNTHPIATPLTVQRHRVEITDQAGAEHRDHV